MVEAPLALLQEWRKMLLGHSVKIPQVTLGLIPEVFDAVDVVPAGGAPRGV